MNIVETKSRYKHSEETKEKIRRKALGRKCPESQKQKLRDMFSLEKSVRWKEGIDHDSVILIKILKRAGRDVSMCSVCGKKVSGAKRHVHHIDKNRKNNKVSNLKVVCAICHKKIHGYGFYKEQAEKEGVTLQAVWARVKRKENPEKFRKKGREYYAKNLEKCKAKQRAANKRFYQKHKDKVKLENKLWRIKNRDKYNARQRKYLKNKRNKLKCQSDTV